MNKKCTVCQVEDVFIPNEDKDSWRAHFPICLACSASSDGIQYLIEKKIRFQIVLGSLFGRPTRFLSCYETIGPELAPKTVCFYTAEDKPKMLRMGVVCKDQVPCLERIAIRRIPRGSIGISSAVTYIDYIDAEDIACLLLPITL